MILRTILRKRTDTKEKTCFSPEKNRRQTRGNGEKRRARLPFAFSCLCLTLLLLAGSICLPAAAREAAGQTGDCPSLFCNSEVWLKDSLAPLLQRGEADYVPVELLAQLPSVTMRLDREEDNILLYTETGYASIRYRERTAAVNDEIVENVPILRQNGFVYLQMDWIAPVLHLRVERAQDGVGNPVLRVSDVEETETLPSLSSLMAQYIQTAEPEPEGQPEHTAPAEKEKTIVLWCRYASENWDPMQAAKMLANSGLTCTMFWDENTAYTAWTPDAAAGKGGVVSMDGSLASAEAANDRLWAYTLHRSPYVLVPSDTADTSALTEAGYRVLRPDFTVNAYTNAAEVLAEIQQALETRDSVTLLLGADSQSAWMVSLLCDLFANEQNGYGYR